jgi:hypothetical protein
MLTDSVVQDDGTITVCGHVGIMINGYMNEWRVVEYAGPNRLDFCAIRVLGNRTYVADGHSLRTLRGGALEVVDFGVGDIVPSSSLESANGVLLSVAGKEVFVTRDGQRWTSLLPEE